MTSGEIRALRPDEIECRVQRVTEKGVVLLLYKDARCDMAILDETFTPFGWQRTHEVIKNKEFCTVSVKSDSGEWVSKQDCGTESNTEKEKGESSDAFKRACSNWGIGRELYTKIFIFIPVPTVKAKNGDKWEMADKFAKFTVSSIETDNKAKKILKLSISDKNHKAVFSWDNKNPPIYEEEETAPEPPQQQAKKPQPKAQPLTEKRIQEFWDWAGADNWTEAEVKELAEKEFGTWPVGIYDTKQLGELCDKMIAKRKGVNHAK